MNIMSSDEEDPFYKDIDNQEIFSKIDYVANLMYKQNDDEKYDFITEMEEQLRFQGPENMSGVLNELEKSYISKNNDYSDDFEEDSGDDNIEDSDDDTSNEFLGINDFSNDILKNILFSNCIKLKDFQEFMKLNKYYFNFCKTIYKEKVKLWEEFEMEDSYKKGKKIELSFKKKPSDCKHLSELIKVCENANFGDILFLDSYRDTQTIILGKNQELIHNPDYSGSGYLSISYEITRFLKDATEKFKGIEYNTIDLRYDDKWVIDNLNTDTFSIPDDWRVRLWWDNMIEIFFPDKVNHLFDLENLNANKINNWYLSSSKPKIKIKVSYSIEGNKYIEFKKKYTTTDKYSWKPVRPTIPDSWSIENGVSGGSGKHHKSTYFYIGPLQEKDIVIKSINTFYEGFHFEIKEELI